MLEVKDFCGEKVLRGHLIGYAKDNYIRFGIVHDIKDNYIVILSQTFLYKTPENIVLLKKPQIKLSKIFFKGNLQKRFFRIMDPMSYLLNEDFLKLLDLVSLAKEKNFLTKEYVLGTSY